MMRSTRKDDGYIEFMFPTFIIAIMLIGGFLYDTGMMMAQTRLMINEADSIARSGAMEMDVETYRETGQALLDLERAYLAANEAAVAHGYSGHLLDFFIDIDQEQRRKVNVTVESEWKGTFPFFPSRTISVSSSSDVLVGIRGTF